MASRRKFLRQWVDPLAAFTDVQGALQVAVIDPEMCTAWDGSDCRVCEAACPRPGAIRWVGAGPAVAAAECDGCGRCIPACDNAGSAGAIRLVAAAGGRERA